MDNPLKPRILTVPTQGEIGRARRHLGDSMEQAAARVHTDRTTWWRWENGQREMPLSAWELYLIKARRALRKKQRASG